MQKAYSRLLLVVVFALSGCDSAAKETTDGGRDAGNGKMDSSTGKDAGDASEPMTFSVGGAVTGLVGSGLVLQNSGGDDLPIDAPGAFAFSKKLSTGADYAVSIKTQPTAPETCEVEAGAGTIATANVTDVVITCRTPYTIDQLIGSAITGSLPTYKTGQTFFVPTTARLTKIDVWAAARFAGVQLPSDTTVEIYAVANGLPTGAALATSSVVAVQPVAAMHSFTFSTPATLTGGETYAAIVTCAGSNEVNVSLDTSNPYAGGTLVWNIPDSPMAVPANDLRFQAFLGRAFAGF